MPTTEKESRSMPDTRKTRSRVAPSAREFARSCREEAARMPPLARDYVAKCIDRFHKTYLHCLPDVAPGSRILSVGAGPAIVEMEFARRLNAEVTVVDFPEAVSMHGDGYRRHGFHAVGGDLTRDWRLEDAAPFDAAFSFEVMEHLPMSPRRHLAALTAALRPGGHVFVTTPNLARLSNILRLIAGRTIHADADVAFEAASHELEHLHRREYVTRELLDAMRREGLTPVKHVYLICAQESLGWAKDRGYRLLCSLLPRLASVTLTVGRKDA